MNRLKFKPSDEQTSKITSICNDIETELFKSHSDEKKYLAQYRRIVQNIKDRKYSLYKSLLKEKILPVDLVKMDSSQMLNTASKKFKVFIEQQRDADRVHLEKSAKEFNQRPICKGIVLHVDLTLFESLFYKNFIVRRFESSMTIMLKLLPRVQFIDHRSDLILLHFKFKSISSPLQLPCRNGQSWFQAKFKFSESSNHCHNTTIL